MGCAMSNDHQPFRRNIRVVHLDGRIEDYNVPMKVNQIINNPNKEVMCTKSQLLSQASSKAFLKSECELELGNLYFLMPISAFKSEASMMDMANMVSKLTHIAKSTRLNEEFLTPARGTHSSQVEGGKRCGSLKKERYVWKPVLDTINENSNGISECDLQDYC